MTRVRTVAANHIGELASSARFFAVTTNDATDLTNGVCRSLFIGGAGNLVVHNEAGTSVTFAVIAGQTLNIRTKRVLATGTTATGIVALY